ncbi:MAG: putative membrane protein YdjX (TVP38/TMEM64 family), partial [Arenicella sp.]
CGALMGVSNGIIFVSFATAISATITFFFSRYMFRLSIQKKYRERLELLLAKCEPVQI